VSRERLRLTKGAQVESLNRGSTQRWGKPFPAAPPSATAFQGPQNAPPTHVPGAKTALRLHISDFHRILRDMDIPESQTGSFMAEDPLDDVLNLEEQLYEQGYREGIADGTRAGRIEGRTFGLEKGFEKFLESGRLYGRSIIWANRLPNQKRPDSTSAEATETSQAAIGDGGLADHQTPVALPPLPNNSKLAKNITTLHALVEPDSLSTENTDDAVTDFDDRMRRAQGKVKIIEKMVGEDGAKEQVEAAGPSSSRASTGSGGQMATVRDGSW